MIGRSRTLATLAGATALSQGLVIIASPILTRLYAPSDFGIYAGAVSLVSIVTVVACLRYEQAIPLPEDSRTVASLIVLCLGLAAVSTLLLGIALVVAGDRVRAILGLRSMDELLVPILIGVVGGAWYSTLSGWATRVMAFGNLARTRVSQAIGLMVLQVVFGVLGAGPTGLLFGDAVGRSAGTSSLARVLWSAESAMIRSVSVATVVAAARRYRRFAFLSTPSAVLDIVAIQAPIWILLALFGAPVAGWYLLASRVATAPNALAAASVGPVFLAETADLARQDRSKLATTFAQAVRRLTLIGIAPCLLLMAVAPFAFPIIFGEAWATAGIFAALLAPMFFTQLITSPVSGILVVLERQDLHLAREFVSIALLAVGYGIAVIGRLNEVATVLILSAAGTLSALVYLAVMWAAVTKSASAKPGTETQ